MVLLAFGVLPSGRYGCITFNSVWYIEVQFSSVVSAVQLIFFSVHLSLVLCTAFQYCTRHDVFQHMLFYAVHSIYQYSSVQQSSVQYSMECSVQGSFVQYNAVQCNTVQLVMRKYSSVQYNQYSSVQYITVYFSTIQFSIVHFCTVQFSTGIPYNLSLIHI